MMKKLALLLCCLLCVSACGTAQHQAETAPATWQEQYDLGMRYLGEGNYAEAILAFTASIEIDPKQAQVYAGRGDAYAGLGDYEHARADYEQALTLDGTLELQEKLDTVREAIRKEQASAFVQEYQAAVEQLDLPFAVDDVVLGETSIEVPKSLYAGRQYAFTNLMNDDTQDTVYDCYGMNDMPIPEGRRELQFGFIFAAPVGGAVSHVYLSESGFSFLGGMQVNDPAQPLFELLGLPSELPDAELEWELLNGGTLRYDGNDTLKYSLGAKFLKVTVSDGRIYSFALGIEE